MEKVINDFVLEQEKTDLHSLSAAFFKAGEKSKQDKENNHYLLFSTYAIACQMSLNPDNKLKPFNPMFVNYQENTRTLDADDFNEEQLNILNDTYAGIHNLELKCRVADIIWVRKRNHKAAIAAINSYIGLFEHFVDVNEFHDALIPIERAIRLVYHCGQKEKYIDDITSKLETIVLELSEDPQFFFYSKLLHLLLSLPTSKKQELTSQCNALSTIAKEKGDWHWEQEFYEIKADFHRQLKDKGSEIQSLLLAGETIERRGDSCISSSNKNYMSASSWYSQAIEYYRKIPTGKDKADAVHKKLLEIQGNVPHMLGTIESPKIDMSEGIKASKDAVSNKTFFEALYSLSFLFAPPDYEKEKENAKELMKKYPLQSMFGKEIINSEGKVTGRVPSAFSDSVEEQELCLWDKTVEQAKYLHFFHVIGIIKPAITQICMEHPFRYEDFYPVVVQNPFVPRGREIIFAKGFYYGLCLDWMEACHLLIPQIENSIRYILQQNGIDSSTFDSKGIQDADSLNKSLEEPKLIEILGKDTVLDLKVILIDRFGYNLRNEMAHGLMSWNGLNAPVGAYLWWFVLRLCMIPHLNLRIHEQNKKEDEDGALEKVEEKNSTR